MSRSPFGSLRPPRPPAELRAQVLAACRGAGAHEPPGLLDLLWQSRRARRAWLAAVILLALANLAVLQPPAGSLGVAKVAPGADRSIAGLQLPPWWRPAPAHGSWGDFRGGVGLEELASQ